jgi:hypothetical protein
VKLQVMNPVTAAGHTEISNIILLRKDITPTAKLLYGYLIYLQGQSVEPSKESLAADLGVSVSAVAAALSSLAKAPVSEGHECEGIPPLLVSKRRGLGLTNVYQIFDPVVPESETTGSLDSTLLDDSIEPVPARAGFSFDLEVQSQEQLQDQSQSQELVGSSAKALEPTSNSLPPPLPHSDRPPRLHKVAGQDLPFNALRAACGIRAIDENRNGEIAAALNGGKGIKAGIRKYGWLELVADGFGGDPMAARVAVTQSPETFERAVVAMIERRADQYRRAMSGATLTPLALAKWWLSLEGMAAGKNGGGLTAAQMAAFPDA